MATVTENLAPQATGNPQGLLRALLEESRELTAVERFARLHEEAPEPAQAKYYRDLIPAGEPGEGQQYAFDVDLDACSGCKACVSACHHLNGLEPTETWRAVGQLYGSVADTSAANGSAGLPIIQHVTTACHHCVDPGCLSGCPTNAYEKDPDTGIVRHLDDQCFGCQYCTMACPYEVPQYSPSKGIVRKCDMCHGRLAAGEAPACVQACPNQAIRITLVDVDETIAATDRGVFLPDTPPADLTHPTTQYRTTREFSDDLAGADAGHAEPQHAHAPLVVMLVMTQVSVGLVAAGAVCRWFGSGQWVDAAIVLGMLAGQAGLAVAPLHLGRPHLAFRAVLGWRHSWLSREAILFGVYAAFSVGAAVLAALPHLTEWIPAPIYELTGALLPGFLRGPVELLAIVSGLVAVFCSAMIYVFTARAYWLGWRTFTKFFGTPIVMGLAGAAAVASMAGAPVATLSGLAALAITAKLTLEASSLFEPAGDLGLTAGLLRGDLSGVWRARFIAGLVGLGGSLLAALGLAPLVFAPAAAAALLFGELAERWLYFSSVVPLRMPKGAPTS